MNTTTHKNRFARIPWAKGSSALDAYFSDKVIQCRIGTQTPFRRIQVSAPGRTESATRVYKDLLRVGVWSVPDDVIPNKRNKWPVDRRRLDLLVRNFQKMRNRGVVVPWIYNHDGGADERIGDLVRVWRNGDELFGELEVTEEKHRLSFGNKVGDRIKKEVSIEVTPNFEDGTGKKYSEAITHVAVVNNPVVNNQKPFIRLSNGINRKVIQMAEDAKPADAPEKKSGGSGDDATEMPVADVVGIINEYFGVKLPDGVETVKELKLVLVAASSPEEPAEPEPESEPAPTMDPNNGGDSPMLMSLKREKAKREAAEKQVVEARKAAWRLSLSAGVASGQIEPGEEEELSAIAESKNYDVDYLKPYLARQAKSGVIRASLGASGKATAVPTTQRQKPTDEECMAAASAIRAKQYA